MMWLASGALLWSGTHLFNRIAPVNRIAPEARAGLGNTGRPLMALLLCRRLWC